MYKLINPDYINRQFIEQLGRETYVEIICDGFKETYKETLAEIEVAVKNRNFKGIKEKVHSIKSNLLFFFDRTSEFGIKIQELEDKGRNEDEKDIEMLFENFKLNCEKTIEELDRFLKE